MSKRNDTFVRDHMPAPSSLPERLDIPGQSYPDRFNVTEILIDDWVAAGEGHRLAFRSLTTMWTYGELQFRVSRYATALIKRLGLIPGNRVLLRGRNSPTLAALHLAVIRAGGIVVSTMPMLRAGELQSIIRKAEVSHAICERELSRELDRCRRTCPTLRSVSTYAVRADNAIHDASDIDFLARLDSAHVTPFRAAADSPCVIAFTSGTTGVPKGAIHSHRDLLAICDTFSAHILNPTPFDMFCGSPPLAFTYGLGGLLLFPLRVGASALLLEDGRPEQLLEAIEKCHPTICFTSATAYRMILPIVERFDISSLRACVSAGETLPRSTFEAFRSATGLRLIDGIGSTELLHIFISAAGDDIRPGATGKVVPGFEATILDEAGNELPDHSVGWLAVRGPTGCCYLNDERQSTYVRKGWNVTGDAYYRDADGYYWYQGRMDDLIVSSGYKVVPTEVEAALLSHSAVAECAVIGVPCARRGHAVKAYVVLVASAKRSGGLESELRKHARTVIAPYKAPREIAFVDNLPKTPTGKIKRFALRETEAFHAA